MWSKKAKERHLAYLPYYGCLIGEITVSAYNSEIDFWGWVIRFIIALIPFLAICSNNPTALKVPKFVPLAIILLSSDGIVFKYRQIESEKLILLKSEILSDLRPTKESIKEECRIIDEEKKMECIRNKTQLAKLSLQQDKENENHNSNVRLNAREAKVVLSFKDVYPVVAYSLLSLVFVLLSFVAANQKIEISETVQPVQVKSKTAQIIFTPEQVEKIMLERKQNKKTLEQLASEYGMRRMTFVRKLKKSEHAHKKSEHLEHERKNPSRYLAHEFGLEGSEELGEGFV